jgi:hypothetical protein
MCLPNLGSAFGIYFSEVDSCGGDDCGGSPSDNGIVEECHEVNKIRI